MSGAVMAGGAPRPFNSLSWDHELMSEVREELRRLLNFQLPLSGSPYEWIEYVNNKEGGVFQLPLSG
jgi:hypothetical protein